MSCVLYFLLLQWSLTKAYACAGGLQIPSCQNRISDACSLALRWTIYSFCKCLAPRWSVCLFLECSGRGFQHSTNALNFFAECDASVKCAVLPRATLELCGPPLISYCHCCRWCILSPGARISRAASRVSGIREEKNYRFRKGGTTAIVEQEWTWWQSWFGAILIWGRGSELEIVGRRYGSFKLSKVISNKGDSKNGQIGATCWFLSYSPNTRYRHISNRGVHVCTMGAGDWTAQTAGRKSKLC